MLVLRVPAFRPLEFRLLFFCGRHVSPRSTQLRQLRAQVPGVIRELLHVADGLKLRLPGGWSLVQIDPRESQALLHLRRHRRRCRRQRPLIYRLPRLIINPSPSSSGRACAVTRASEELSLFIFFCAVYPLSARRRITVLRPTFDFTFFTRGYQDVFWWQVTM